MLPIQPLKEALADWESVDGSSYKLALALGSIPADVSFGEAKGVFWSANPHGNALYALLLKMAELGILECKEDELFRWNPNFSCSEKRDI